MKRHFSIFGIFFTLSALCFSSCSHILPEETPLTGDQSLLLNSPTNGQAVTNGFFLSAVASDSSTLLSAFVLVYNSSGGATNVLPVRIGSGSVSAQLSFPAYGGYRLRLEGVDSKSGTVFSPEVSVTAVIIPPLVLTAPAIGGNIGYTNTLVPTLDGGWSGANGLVTLIQVTNLSSSNYQAFTVNSNSFSFPLSGLTPGTNRLTVTAMNALGISGDPVFLTVILDTVSPLLTITSPTAGQNVSSVYQLTGTASDALSGPASVWVSHQGGAFCQAVLQGSGWSVDLSATQVVITDLVYVLDRAGNSSVTNQILFARSDAPWVTLAGPAASSWINASFVDFYGSAGVASPRTLSFLNLRVNGAALWSITNPPASWLLGSVGLPLEGSNRIDLSVMDSSGQVFALPTFTVLRDTGIPTISSTAIATNWTNAVDLDIVYQAYDSLSGVAREVYSLNGGAETLMRGGIASLSSVPEGSNQLLSWAVDLAGNSSVTQSNVLLVDRSAPVLGAMVLPSYIDTSNFSTNLMMTDAYSGVASNAWRVNGGGWISTTTNFAVFSNLVEGSNTLNIMGFDRAGNSSSLYTWSIGADFTPPVILQTAYTDNQQVGAFFTVAGTVTDALSGVASVKVQTNSGPWSTLFFFPSGNWSKSYTATVSGNMVVSWFAVDHVGNISATNTVSLNIIAVPDAAITNVPALTFYTNLTGIDLAGTASILLPYSIDGVAISLNSSPYSNIGSGSSWTAPGVSLPDEGTNTVQLQVTSGAKTNHSSVYNIIRDTVPPTVSFTPAAPVYLTTAYVMLDVQASDTLSGVASLEYRLNGGAWNLTTLGTVRYNLVEGSNSLDFLAKDKAGNISATDTFSTVVDTVPPVLTDANLPMYTNVYAFNISPVFTDATSGVARTWFCLDGGSWNEYTNTALIAVIAAGNHTLSLRASDNAGNTCSATNFGFSVDVTPPVIGFSNFVNQQQILTNTLLLPVQLSYSDDSSNFGELLVILNGTDSNVLYPSANSVFTQLTLSFSPGSNLVQATIFDAAGNSSNQSVVVFVSNGVAFGNTNTFLYTGAVQNWTVPVGVTDIIVTAVGAAGSDGTNSPNNTPGKGGSITGEFNVIPGEILYICAGSIGTHGGYNGGGPQAQSPFYTGGGASDVRTNTSLTDRIIVAGGGGAYPGNGGMGGDGAGLYDTNGAAGLGAYDPTLDFTSIPGGGGTETSGGTAGVGNYGPAPTAGSLGTGGTGYQWGGSGGGGYYGGGGGGSELYGAHAGGGGGSSYLSPSGTFLTGTNGFNTGDGYVIICY
jgi:hypothetical protein